MRHLKLQLAAVLLTACAACAAVPAVTGNIPCIIASAAVQEFTEDTKIEADVTIEGDLIVDAALDLNGHTLTVTGDLIQKSGTLYISNGSTLKIGGSYAMQNPDGTAGKGEFRMQAPADVKNQLEIGGDFIVNTTIPRSYYQSTGTITIGGDLIVRSPEGGQGLEPNHSNVNFVFKGKKQHKIDFDSSTLNALSTVSADAGGILYFTNATTGFSLASDILITGDSRITGGTNLELNGHNMTVGGCFVQDGDMSVILGGGTLQVNGDYLHKRGILAMSDSTVKIAGDYLLQNDEKTPGTGDFRMQGTDNLLDIDGSLIVNTTIPRAYYQTVGTVKIGGDLRAYSPEGGQGLEFGKQISLLFKGRKQHEIYFDNAAINKITNVSVDERGSLKIAGETTGFTLQTDAVFAGGCRFTGSTPLVLNGHSVTVNGDFIQDVSGVNAADSKLTVKGTYRQRNGVFQMTNSTVDIAKDYLLMQDEKTPCSGEFRMQGEDNTLNVNGDLICNTTVPRSYYHTVGTVNLGGDLKCYAPEGGQGIEFGTQVSLMFRRNKQHELFFENANISFVSMLGMDAGSSVWLNGETSGFTLTTDAVFTDSSRVTGSRNFVLGGHAVTVNGSFTQDGPTVNLDGGKMHLAGDYKLQSGLLAFSGGTINAAKDFKMCAADGTAVRAEYRMQQEGSALITGGDVIINSTVPRSYYQTEGLVCVGGSLKVFAPEGGQGFEAGVKIVTEFRGGKAHEIFFEKEDLSLKTLRLGIGDTIKFTGTLDGLAAAENAVFRVEPADIAAADGLSVTGKKAGEATLTIESGTAKKTQALVIGGSETEAVFSGETVDPTRKSKVVGDVNGDGTFTVSDAILMQRWLSGDDTALMPVWENGDFKPDGVLTAADLTLMKQALVKQPAAKQ